MQARNTLLIMQPGDIQSQSGLKAIMEAQVLAPAPKTDPHTDHSTEPSTEEESRSTKKFGLPALNRESNLSNHQ